LEEEVANTAGSFPEVIADFELLAVLTLSTARD
jgi:hypothetical protein